MKAPQNEEFGSFRKHALTSAGIALACVATLMATPWGKTAAMPGPLSATHAHLAKSCEACHVDAADAIQSPLHGVSITKLDQGQSKLCLECHHWQEHALQPHGWSPGDLLNKRLMHTSNADLKQMGVPTDAEGRLACATCHREHRGRDRKLNQLDDTRCQACHSNSFESLNLGHPAFSEYPQERRTNLIFDHGEHILEHFRGEQQALAPDSCTVCHQMDSAGRRMPVKDYESACMDCHDADIRGNKQLQGAGMPVLGLPAIDTMTLEERNIGIGQWPADSGLTEAPLTPFMHLLLSSDERAQDDLEHLQGVDLLDLSEQDDAILRRVARIAWNIKELFAEIKTGGHHALLERLERVFGADIEPQERDALLAGLPEDLVSQAIGMWLPKLSDELLQHAENTHLPTLAEVELVAPDIEKDRLHEQWVDTGGWYFQGLDYALRYRPIGHADPFLVAWLQLSAVGKHGFEPVFELLANPASQGACTKCHSVEKTPQLTEVHWNDALEQPDSHALTVFSHNSHFAMATDNACAHCHRLNRDASDWARTYAGGDARQFTPGFHPIQVSECASCHMPGGAPSNCLTCHRYHPLLERSQNPAARLSALALTQPDDSKE